MPMMPEPEALVYGEEEKEQTLYIFRSVNKRIRKEIAGREVKKGRPPRAVLSHQEGLSGGQAWCKSA